MVREPMRVAYILAENLTDEERKLLMGVSSRPMPIDTDDMKALSALRLIEREIGGHTARHAFRRQCHFGPARNEKERLT